MDDRNVAGGQTDLEAVGSGGLVDGSRGEAAHKLDVGQVLPRLHQLRGQGLALVLEARQHSRPIGLGRSRGVGQGIAGLRLRLVDVGLGGVGLARGAVDDVVDALLDVVDRLVDLRLGIIGRGGQGGLRGGDRDAGGRLGSRPRGVLVAGRVD